MTTYSRTDLATRVLKDLGIVDASETPAATDLEWAEETIASEVAMLAVKGITIWNGSDEALPLEYLTLMSRRICLAVAPSFGLTDVAQATIAMKAVEQDLRIMATKPGTGVVLETEHF